MKSVEVTVLGRTFTVKTDDTEEHVQAVASYVNTRYEEIGGGARVPPQNVILLTALNLADELFKERARHRALKEAVRLRGSALLRRLDKPSTEGA